MTNSLSYLVRPADIADIPVLIELRLAMFQAMGRTDAAILDAVATASATYLREHLPDGSFRAWLAEVDGRIAATGGVVIHQSPPSYKNLTGREGYIMGVFTRPEFRRQGLATAIMNTILDSLRSEGVQRATLRASPEGRLVYEKLGFEPTTEMRLKL